MSDKQKNFLKSTLGTAFATFISRILGLIRVMLESRVLGGGTVASAWGFAFTIPNMFRRIFGEGALGTALIPILVQLEAQEGIEKTRKNLGIVFTFLSLILAIIVLLISVIAIICEKFVTTEHIKLGLKLLPILMPYAFFICLVGVAQAILNCRKVFVLPAYGALILNFMLISTLGLLAYWQKDWKFVLDSLSTMVLAAGVIHLALMIILMKYYRIFPDFKFSEIAKKPILMTIYKKTLPGIIGGSVLQLSLLIDRFLAMFIGTEALPAMTYTERIVYLPIGIVAISFGSVLQVNMAKSVAAKNNQEIIEDLIFGLRHVFFLCVPLTFFILLFRYDIIISLFYSGNFTMNNVQATAWAMLFYSLGICFFCILKLVTPLFFSRGDMVTPLKSSIAVLIFNAILSFTLMFPMQQGGIALATAISSLANNAILLWIFSKQCFPIPLKRTLNALVKALIATAIALNIYWATRMFDLASYSQAIRFVILIAEAGVFGIIYLGSSALLKNQELSELFNHLLRRRKK